MEPFCYDRFLHVLDTEGILQAALYMKRYDLGINGYRDADLGSLIDIAIRRNKPNLVQGLIDMGAELNVLDCDGYTPLLLAIYCDDLEIVKILIAAGANIHVQDNYGRGVLHKIMLSNNKNIPLIQYLIDIGADVNLRENLGRNPLMYSTAHMAKEAYELLKTYGGDPTMKDNDGRDALFLAEKLCWEIRR